MKIYHILILVALYFFGKSAKEDADKKVLQECMSIIKDTNRCDELYNNIKHK